MCKLFELLIYLIILNRLRVLGVTVRKFVYQKDMSEHCRRRVVPSVFLGRDVVEAHSQILHFSKMELPYSCFISVRAEPGNNIVLVVQLLSEDSQVRACADCPNQLVVYDFGETFGGYWGPLPDSVLRPGPTASTLYTRKTTHTTATETSSRTAPDMPISTVSVKTPVTEDKEGDFIRVEVPLVEVSGALVDDQGPPKPEFDPDETFDLLYDVTPRRKTQYRTKILPVAQFSIKEKGGRRGDEPFFDLEYEAPMYTAAGRMRTTKRRNLPATNFYVNRLLNFRHTTSTYVTEKETLDFKNNYFTKDKAVTVSLLNTTLPSTKTYFIHSTNSPIIRDWKDIEKIIKNLNKSSVDADNYQNKNMNISNILETIANMKHNRSVYLASGWSTVVNHDKIINYINVTEHFSSFTRTPLKLVSYSTKNILQSFRKATVDPNSLIKAVKNESTSPVKMNTTMGVSVSTNDHNTLITKIITTLHTSLTTSEILRNYSESSTETIDFTVSTQETVTENDTIFSTTVKNSAPLTGSMVGHESWENVVQAAPVMAVLLNKTLSATAGSNDFVTGTTTVPSNKKQVRIKRKIKSIPIYNARPRQLSTRELVTTMTTRAFRMSDLQSLAQMVELNDDELYDRVALRYLRQYVGSKRFSLCANGEPKARHIFLFNSSRIVIAINNFTLERMTVMLTPAYALLGARGRCSSSALECQVLGTRICIDALNACDGIPNCGVYDIYDEDRLLCGAAGGLQHNVYLAAVTFLALLLTVMYTVHYWLRRCVPKVSQAFFIYTDGAENILYLETIMRSPNDMNYDKNKMAYQENTLSYDDLCPDITKKVRKNCIIRMITACLNIWKCKRKKKQLSQDQGGEELDRNNDLEDTFSLPELELNKLLYHTERTDAGIQTGDSLEMSQINITKLKDSVERLSTSKDIFNRRAAKVSLSSIDLDDNFRNQESELNMLKFFKDVETGPVPSTSRQVSGGPPIQHRGSIEEKVLRTHVYDDHTHTQKKGRKNISVKSLNMSLAAEEPETSKQLVKRLRFDEEATAFSYDSNNDEEAIQQSNIALTHGESKEGDSGKTENIVTGASRDFKRFWKSKKTKKKAHLSIR